MKWRINLSAQWIGAEELSAGAALAFAIMLIGIYWFSFSWNEDCLMLGLDGTWYRTMFANEAVDRLPFSQSGVDALTGNFDAWYPLRPEFLLPHALTLPFTPEPPAKPFIYTVFSIFLALAIYAVGRSVQAGRAAALVAGLSMPILAGAGLVGGMARLYPLLELNPYWFQSIGLGCFIIAAFWAMDSNNRPGRMALLVSAPTLCLMLAMVGLTPHVLFMVPVVGAYAAGSFLATRRWADLVPRIAALVLMTAVPAALGVFTYYQGIIGYSAFHFFPDEIPHPLIFGSWKALSSLFWTSSPTSHIAAWVILLGIAGALWTAFVGAGRFRLFALTHLVASAMYFIVAYWLIFFVTNYNGSYPVYFETGIWPFSLMFAAVAIAAVLQSALKLVDTVLSLLRKLRRSAGELSHDAGETATSHSTTNLAIRWLRRRTAGLTLVGAISAICATNLNAVINPKPNLCVLQGGFAPIRATVITDILHQNIALRAGVQFRGMVATITATRPDKHDSNTGTYNFDRDLWRETGNDHRAAGLWNFDIPTLFQYHRFVTPPYYLVTTDFLSDPTDLIIMTRIHPALMALWGVRYVITDTDTEVGREVASLSTADLGTLRLLELANPNLGNYSPVQAVRADDFGAALQLMHKADFDGSRMVLTEESLDQPLEPATQAYLVYTKQGLHLKAESTGHSVLVLPAQFSHCWTVHGTGEPRLFRANATQLGVSFVGRLDAQLIFRLGPILEGACRIDDIKDMERLRMAGARAMSRQDAPK